jgi:hypothetical protein
MFCRSVGAWVIHVFRFQGFRPEASLNPWLLSVAPLGLPGNETRNPKIMQSGFSTA